MDYTNINNRLDLDNQMMEVANDYPKNDDDYFFYIRGKNSTQEFFFAVASETGNFGYALFNIATQNEIIKAELLYAVDALKKSEELNNI